MENIDGYKLCPQEEFKTQLQLLKDKDLFGNITNIYELPLSEDYYHKIYANRKGGHFTRTYDDDNALVFQQMNYDYVSSFEGPPTLISFGILTELLFKYNDYSLKSIFEEYYNRQYKSYKTAHNKQNFEEISNNEFCILHIEKEKRLYHDSEDIFNYLFTSDIEVLRDLVTKYFEYLNMFHGIEEQRRGLLPPELDTPRAKEIFDKAINMGYMNKNGIGYEWNNKGQLLAYFCQKLSLLFNLSNKMDKDGNKTINWVVFNKLFNKNSIKSYKNDFMKVNTKFEPSGYEIIDTWFK